MLGFDMSPERFNQALAASGLTKYRLAKQAHVSTSLIDKWERGDVQEPYYSTVTKIANVLKVTPEWLMGEEETPNATNEALRSRLASYRGKRGDVVDAVLDQAFRLAIFDIPGTLEKWASLPERKQDAIADMIRFFWSEEMGMDDAEKQAKK